MDLKRPHIGISESGEVGKYLREVNKGQQGTAKVNKGQITRGKQQSAGSLKQATQGGQQSAISNFGKRQVSNMWQAANSMQHVASSRKQETKSRQQGPLPSGSRQQPA